MGKNTSEEAEENESALSPNAEGPSIWDSGSESETETYVQTKTEDEVLNDPQPVSEVFFNIFFKKLKFPPVEDYLSSGQGCRGSPGFYAAAQRPHLASRGRAG